MSLFVAWLGRRALELGGLAAALFQIWAALPPGTQAALGAILTNKWQSVTLGALAPLAVALWGYLLSLRATLKPQIVVNGKQTDLKKLSGPTKALVEQAAAAAPKKSLGDVLGGLFKR